MTVIIIQLKIGAQTKRPKTKLPKGQNVLRHKVPWTKRPKRQNVPRTKYY